MKKTIIIISTIIISLIILLCSIYLIHQNKEKQLIKNIKTYDVEVYDEIKLSKVINIKIIDDIYLDTSSLGKKRYKYYYELDGKKKKNYVDINVIDKTPPLVWLKNSYTVTVNSDDHLLDNILCGDNYDKRPNCEIKGKYDLNNKGTYKLEFIATDSSNNKTKINFNLNVIEDITYEENNTKTLYNEIYKEYKDSNNKIGIDISAWQKNVDFKKIKDNNVEFVMLRLGYQEDIKGELVLDNYFETNIKKAIENDLDVGVYFYSKASSIAEAKKQAEFVYKNIKDYKITLPVVFDWEIYTSFNSLNISLHDLNSISNTFLEKIQKYGYKSALYGSKNYLNSIWTNNKYDTWLAHYTNKTDYDKNYFMWQMCNDGIIDGIDGYVDIDILYR